MQVHPYLYFDGRCDEAIEFYRDKMNATVVSVTRFGDPPGSMQASGAEKKIMHAVLAFGDTQVFASDGQNSGKPAFQGFSLSLTVDSDSDAARMFAVLGDGGAVIMPLMATLFSSSFGMAADKFGVSWTVSTPPKGA